MIVAAVAGIFIISLGVASGAGLLALTAVVEWKIMQAQPGGLPGSILVTHLAALPKEAGVDLGFCMAGGAYSLRLVERLTVVTVCAYQTGMPARQLKNGAMVKARHPVNAIVAFSAGYTE